MNEEKKKCGLYLRLSAKTGNHRPEFERLKNDIKAKKINTICKRLFKIYEMGEY